MALRISIDDGRHLNTKITDSTTFSVKRTTLVLSIVLALAVASIDATRILVSVIALAEMNFMAWCKEKQHFCLAV